jgi:hypothetical protein
VASGEGKTRPVSGHVFLFAFSEKRLQLQRQRTNHDGMVASGVL